MGLILLVTVLSLIVVVVVLIEVVAMREESTDNSKTSYECGFEGITKTRVAFSYRFFVIAILFLIFDVELILMLPVPLVLMGISNFTVFFLFGCVLVGGLMYELSEGMLEWSGVSKA